MKSHIRPLLIFIHIVSWLLVFGFPLIFSDRDASFSFGNYFHRCCLPMACFIMFYINYLWLVPKFFLSGKKKRFFILEAVFVIVVSILLFFVLQVTRPDFLAEPMAPAPHLHLHMPPKWIFTVRDVVIIAFSCVLGTALKVSVKWEEAEKRMIAAEQQRTEAELKSLKNQLNPHFLLNTLNNIYALIAFDTDKAQSAVEQLSKLLRYVLYDNQNKFVPLHSEVEFIRNYISLMRIRVSSHVKVNVSINISGGESIMIAPLIFISLIENAFKHGISPTSESWIDISIEANDSGVVRCKTINTNYPKTPADKSGSGIGLSQVQKRLDLLYLDKYQWTKLSDALLYTSSLTIYTK